ncbi:Signal peptide region containing protein [Cryptosporidium meleagridis]
MHYLLKKEIMNAFFESVKAPRSENSLD